MNIITYKDGFKVNCNKLNGKYLIYLKVLTWKTLKDVSSMKSPRVNPILGPLKR